jgi:TonB family protein
MFARIRALVILVGATLLLEGCLVPRNRSDPPVEPQVPVEPQAPARVQEPRVEPQSPAMAQATPSPSASSAPGRVEDDPFYQSYVAERRKTHPAGRWQDSPLTKWTDALQRYESRVKPGNERALNAARRPFAVYLVRMHNRLHPIFADEFLAWLDTLPSTDPRNQAQLVVRIEVATSGTDGRVVRMGVVRSSGVASFDAAALDAMDQAAPFGPPPTDLLSSDGNVYFHWEFHRDPIFACSTINARPYMISVN